MNESFRCENCRETVAVESAPPTCRNCGTTHRYDAATGAYSVATANGLSYDSIVVLLLLAGVVGLYADWVPKSFGWFFAFVGFALHYWNGLRTGVLSSRFLLFRCHWIVCRDESPMAFSLAMIIEGMWVAALLIGFLVSL